MGLRKIPPLIMSKRKWTKNLQSVGFFIQLSWSWSSPAILIVDGSGRVDLSSKLLRPIVYWEPPEREPPYL